VDETLHIFNNELNLYEVVFYYYIFIVNIMMIMMMMMVVVMGAHRQGQGGSFDPLPGRLKHSSVTAS